MTNQSVKILFVGDPHFKVQNTEYIPLFTSRILDVVKSNKLDFIVVAGDLLDNHDRVDVEPLNLALQFIDSLRQQVKTFILVGNHDYKNNQQFLSDHHWMNALKQWYNVTIVDNITTSIDPNKSSNNYQFLFVPYVPVGRFIEAIKTQIPIENISNFKAIFAHQEFYGCKMGPIESKNGDKWDTNWPMIISGHIHNKQWSQKNIYYPGSAMQHAFGQSSGNTISILTFDQDEMSYEEIDLKMPKLTIKYLSCKEVMKDLKFKNKEFRKYKIVLQGTNEEFKTFKKNSRYKQLLEEGYKITFKVEHVTCKPLPDTTIKKTFLHILSDKIQSEKDDDLEAIYRKFVKT